jgi:hypothetical protein
MRERTKARHDAARGRGVRFGRTRKLNPRAGQNWLAGHQLREPCPADRRNLSGPDRLSAFSVPLLPNTLIQRRHRQSQCGKGGMKARGSRLARALGVVGFGALVWGCSETFADQIRAHRGCIGEAQIAPQRVDVCLRNTNGRRQNVNVCLVDSMVPDHNIRMLNDCVDAAEHSRND